MKTYPPVTTLDRTYIASAGGNVRLEDYYFESVTWLKGQKDFNGADRDLQQLHLSGVTLIVDEHDGTPQLWARNKAQNIKSIEIVADELIVRSRWELPGTDVTIYVRRLQIEATGQLVTTPYPRTQELAAPSMGDGPGADGLEGQRAGNLTIFADTFDVPQSSKDFIPFVLTGGQGQDAGPGSNGWKGADAMSLFDDGVQVEYAVTLPWSKNETGSLQTAIDDGIFHNAVFGAFNDQLWAYLQKMKSASPEPITALDVYFKKDLKLHWEGASPQNGERSKFRAGIPGRGGPGGSFTCFFNVWFPADWSRTLEGGPSGNSCLTPGGEPGKVCRIVTATRKVEIHCDHSDNPLPLSSSRKIIPAPVKGDPQDGPPPVYPKGVPGTDTFCTKLAGIDWLHPHHFQAVTHFIDDAYLEGQTETAYRYLKLYLAALDQALDPGTLHKLSQGEANLDAEYAEKLSHFATARGELFARAHRIESNLDFYGNPAGWAPIMSLGSSLVKFDAQAEDTIRTLFLTEWFEDQLTASASVTAAVDTTISDLQHKRNELATSLNSNLQLIPGLIAAAGSVERDLKAAKTELANVETRLLKNAQTNVFAQNAVKALLSTASALCDFIPAGQPVLKTIGSGLKQLADFDFSKDVSAGAPELTGFMAQFGKMGLQSKANDLKAASEKPAAPEKTDTAELARKKTREKAETLSSLAAGLVPLSSELTTQLLSLRVSDADVESELENLEAADPAFQTFAALVRDLNASKKGFADQLTAALQNITDLPGQISESFWAEDALYQDRLKQLNQFSPFTCRFIRGLGMEARRRLAKYQYYMIKAYEYYRLEPYMDADYRMLSVLGEIRNILPPPPASPATLTAPPPTGTLNNPVLTDAQVKTLKQLVAGAKGGIQDRLNSKLASGALGVGSVQPCVLDSDALAPLNDLKTMVGRRIILNPMEAGVISPSLDRVRLVAPPHKSGQPAIHVSRIVLENGIQKGRLTLYIRYFGEGTLRDGVNLRAIRQCSDGAPALRQPMMTWVYNYALSGGPSGPSITETAPADDPDLSAIILSNPDLSNLRDLLSAPPAWTNLEITAEGDLKLLSLELEFGLSAHNAPQDQRVLTVREAKGRSIDLKIRVKDGTGKIIDEKSARRFAYEVYPAGTDIEVTASFPGSVPVEWSNKVTGEIYRSVSQSAKPRPSLGAFSRRLDDHLDLVCSFDSTELPAPLISPVCYGFVTKSSKDAPYYPHTESDGAITKSTHWIPGFRVRYAVSFVGPRPYYKQSDLGPWSDWFSSDRSIHAALGFPPQSPAEQTGEAKSRQLYRQFGDENQPVELLHTFLIDPSRPDHLDPQGTKSSGRVWDTMP